MVQLFLLIPPLIQVQNFQDANGDKECKKAMMRPAEYFS
jgi:hypothetical protein